MQKKGLEEEDARDKERWRWVADEAKYQLRYKYLGSRVDFVLDPSPAQLVL